MINKDNFIKWMEQYTSLSKSSIGKYARSLNKISKILAEEGIADTHMYYLPAEEVKRIEVLLRKNDRYLDADSTGNHMYSNGLKQYIRFLDSNFDPNRETKVYDIPYKHFLLVMDILEDEYDWEGDDSYTKKDKDGYYLGLRAYRLIFPEIHKSYRMGEMWYEDDVEDDAVAEYEENEVNPNKFIRYANTSIEYMLKKKVTKFNIDLAGKIDAEEFKKIVAEAIAEAE